MYASKRYLSYRTLRFFIFDMGFFWLLVLLFFFIFYFFLSKIKEKTSQSLSYGHTLDEGSGMYTILIHNSVLSHKRSKLINIVLLPKAHINKKSF